MIGREPWRGKTILPDGGSSHQVANVRDERGDLSADFVAAIERAVEDGDAETWLGFL